MDIRFIAALDQSGGSTPGALNLYGVEYTEHNMFDKIHDMRMRMVGSPAFNDENIWAAILFKDTVTRGMVNVLHEKGISTFLKIDEGLEEDGTLKNFNVDAVCEWATTGIVPRYNRMKGVGPKIYGTKMRSVVKSKSMVGPVLKQQFALAQIINEYGLVPIIEPEVPIDHPEKADIEKELCHMLEMCLQGKEFEQSIQDKEFKVILKLTPPDTPNLYYNLTTMPAVERVVFLSGGYSTNQACNMLGLNDDVTASFSRALSEGLTYDLTESEFDAKLDYNITMITKASE